MPFQPFAKFPKLNQNTMMPYNSMGGVASPVPKLNNPTSNPMVQGLRPPSMPGMKKPESDKQRKFLAIRSKMRA